MSNNTSVPKERFDAVTGALLAARKRGFTFAEIGRRAGNLPTTSMSQLVNGTRAGIGSATADALERALADLPDEPPPRRKGGLPGGTSLVEASALKAEVAALRRVLASPSYDRSVRKLAADLGFAGPSAFRTLLNGEAGTNSARVEQIRALLAKHGEAVPHGAAPPPPRAAQVPLPLATVPAKAPAVAERMVPPASFGTASIEAVLRMVVTTSPTEASGNVDADFAGFVDRMKHEAIAFVLAEMARAGRP